MVQEQTGYADVEITDSNDRYEQIVHNLKCVYDPEISVNVYDLGLIYQISLGETSCVIIMSLTSAFCPAADEIVNDVRYAALSVDGVEDVDVQITFDPPWGPDKMSEDAKLILGIF